MSVSRLKKTARPDEVNGRQGFDAKRLAAIPAYFESYIEQGRIPGCSVLVARGGEIVLEAHRGNSAMSGEGFALDGTGIFRIYSMTKPITSVALMMLYERARFKLSDPLEKFLPVFKDLQVFDKGRARKYTTKKLDRSITIRDLLTHQSGLTYDFMAAHSVDALYRNNNLVPGNRDETLEQFCARLAEMPLVFSPGEKWNYSVATDVCGRLIEVLSGQTLDAFFQEHIFAPLKMTDTSFTIPANKRARLMNNYHRHPLRKTTKLVDSPERTLYAEGRQCLSGGGGLLSTLPDYYRFCEMLLGRGARGSARLLSRKTLELMTANHLPDNASIQERGDTAFTESGMEGMGFGLGFAINLGAAKSLSPTSTGSFSWGGMASTYFWVDPQEDLTAIFMTQLMPSNAYPMRPQLQQLVYAALVD